MYVVSVCLRCHARSLQRPRRDQPRSRPEDFHAQQHRSVPYPPPFFPSFLPPPPPHPNPLYSNVRPRQSRAPPHETRQQHHHHRLRRRLHGQPATMRLRLDKGRDIDLYPFCSSTACSQGYQSQQRRSGHYVRPSCPFSPFRINSCGRVFEGLLMKVVVGHRYNRRRKAILRKQWTRSVWAKRRWVDRVCRSRSRERMCSWRVRWGAIRRGRRFMLRGGLRCRVRWMRGRWWRDVKLVDLLSVEGLCCACHGRLCIEYPDVIYHYRTL